MPRNRGIKATFKLECARFPMFVLKVLREREREKWKGKRYYNLKVERRKYSRAQSREDTLGAGNVGGECGRWDVGDGLGRE